MAIHPIDFRYGSPEMRSIFTEEARLQKLLDVEAALARAHAVVGNVPKGAAKRITSKANTRYVKTRRVKAIEAQIHHDLMAVVKALTEQCGDAGRYIHLGATSYDIIDTANALQFKDALAIVRKDLFDLEGILMDRAEEHMKTVAVGRTHGQHAVPITYGLKFALWATEVRRHIQRLDQGCDRILMGKMTGAVGTQASFGKTGPRIQRLVMKDLGIKAAPLSNQVVPRDIYAELICLLAIIAATMDKFGKEIRNLMRTEIQEVSEAYIEKKQVGSSTMPHKRNPINTENMCGLARVVKSNVFVALENVSLEHERDLTNSSAERNILPETFILLDETLKRAKKVMAGLVFFPRNIERNLELTGGMEMAESVMMALTKKGMGRQPAHELLRQSSVKAFNQGVPLGEVLKEEKKVTSLLTDKELDTALDPTAYIGTSIQQVRVALKDLKAERKKG